MTQALTAYRPQIEAALVYSGHSHTFDDVAQLVKDGKAQFWGGPTSVVITQVVLEPQHKVLHFFLAGGNLAELEKMTPLIEQWGREQGCTRASLVGRKGWDRTFLSRQGWHNGLVVLEKDLDGQE
jgi:hypothetical protein